MELLDVSLPPERGHFYSQKEVQLQNKGTAWLDNGSEQDKGRPASLKKTLSVGFKPFEANYYFNSNTGSDMCCDSCFLIRVRAVPALKLHIF